MTSIRKFQVLGNSKLEDIPSIGKLQVVKIKFIKVLTLSNNGLYNF